MSARIPGPIPRLETSVFQQRIQESGYGGQPVAENIAVGHTTPSSVVSSGSGAVSRLWFCRIRSG